MQRVLVFGCSGAGKSTFSRRLAEATGLPRTELDGVFWQPGWVMTPRSESFPKIEMLCAKPTWILDGNYTSSLHIRVPRADTAILLAYPRHVCLRQVLTRTLKDYGRVREGMAEGCPEHFSLPFLRYVWNFNRMERLKLTAALNEYGKHLKLYTLASHREADAFLASLAQTGPLNGSRPQSPSPPEPRPRRD